MESVPTLDVIIPTHNRKSSLLRTLDSLSYQTFPVDRFRVIIVDDGSTDDTQSVTNQSFSFNFRYVYQKNQGATAARNYGAKLSQADILIFIDDDVTVSRRTLEALAEICCQRTKALVMGTLISRSNVIASVYTAIMLSSSLHPQIAHAEVELPFVECNTELLACKRRDFFALGMLQDPTRGCGWPNWDDVDFGYRAHMNGFQLIQSIRAIGEHWDYAISDRTVACQRWYRASWSAVWLFNKHQELQTLIPMLSDKAPLAWGQDSALLIARKLARQLMSTQLAMAGMEKFVSILEQRWPSPAVLRRLYHWLHGAYMFRGYRDGLREFQSAGAAG